MKNPMSTQQNYLGIWRNFNKFLLHLEKVPRLWEQRTILFCAHLVDTGLQSSTIKSYISAIKGVLCDDDYQWSENQFVLHTLTKACKNVNDRVHIHRPIRKGVLEVILFELGRIFQDQIYLLVMYRAFFALMYHGLFRIGELALGDHIVKACNVHVARNKDKLLFRLITSKTHNKGTKPQEVKITSHRSGNVKNVHHFCLFKLTRAFLTLHRDYIQGNEQFFVFRDKSPLKPIMVRRVLRQVLMRIGLNPDLYSLHSFHAGRTSDLIKLGYSIEEVKCLGRWKSNAVYAYIKL